MHSAEQLLDEIPKPVQLREEIAKQSRRIAALRELLKVAEKRDGKYAEDSHRRAEAQS